MPFRETFDNEERIQIGRIKELRMSTTEIQSEILGPSNLAIYGQPRKKSVVTKFPEQENDKVQSKLSL